MTAADPVSPPRGNPIALLRTIAIAEAISFLVLLGIAMPLKYGCGLPVAVLVTGAVHGALFLLFSWSLLRVVVQAQWPLPRALLVFVSALLPFGPFVLDGRLRQWSAAWPARR